MSKLLTRDDDKAETAGMTVGLAAYHLAKLSYPLTTAVICGVCLSMLVSYAFTENRRVSLPKWLLLTAFAGLNVYSFHFLNSLLSPWVHEFLAETISLLVVGGTLLAMPKPTGESLLGRFLAGRLAAKALPPTRP